MPKKFQLQISPKSHLTSHDFPNLPKAESKGFISHTHMLLPSAGLYQLLNNFMTEIYIYIFSTLTLKI